MALAKRIIPCLDVTGGRVVKGVNFVELRDAGDPVEIAARYNEQGADELTFLDITASVDGRDTTLHTVERMASQVFIPLTVGGGVRTVQDIRNLLNALKRTLASLLARLKAQGQLVSGTQALGQLVEQITMTLLFSLDYQRILDREGEVRLVVYQIMMLVAPHLLPPAKMATEQLALRYLDEQG